MEDPLIALGLVQDRQQVEDIINRVDDDKTGEIEFVEFLKIISLGKRKTSSYKGDQPRTRKAKADESDDQLGAIVDW